MRVWVLQIGEPLPVKPVREMRTAMLCRALASRGHAVLWWASAFDHFTKEWLFPDETRVTVAPSLEVLALKGCGYSSNMSLRRFVDHRLVARRFRRLVRDEPRPDLIVASMPTHDLAYEAARYAVRHGVPLVVDVRDQWPDWIVERLPAVLRGAARLALHRDYGMVTYLCRHAASLTSMMDSLLVWAQERGGPRGTATDRVFYLGARKLVAGPQEPGTKLRFLDDLRGRTVVSFVGTFGRYYHPGILVDVARRMRGEPVHFVLAGTGDYLEQALTASKDLDNVTLPGWLDDKEIAWLMARSALGVVPCNVDTDAFPNKAFTYFAGGRPVVSSLQGDLRALLEHEGLGRYYPANDVGALVEVIRSLVGAPETVAAMSRNVEAFFARALDADVIYQSFTDHLEAVARAGVPYAHVL